MSTCKICKNEITVPSECCDDCIQKNNFINSNTAQTSYKLSLKNIKSLTKYYLKNTMVQNGLYKYYRGYYYLESDIKNFIKNDKKYIQRISIEAERIYLQEKCLKEQQKEMLLEEQHRTDFVTAVLNKAGYFGQIQLSQEISTYIYHGIISKTNMYEFELYIIGLVLQKYPTLRPKKMSAFELNRLKNKELITNILNLEATYLENDYLYVTFIDYGLDAVMYLDDSIKSLDDFVLHLSDIYCAS